MKTYEKMLVEVVELEKVDIIRTSGEDDNSKPPVDVGNGDTPALPAI